MGPVPLEMKTVNWKTLRDARSHPRRPQSATAVIWNTLQHLSQIKYSCMMLFGPQHFRERVIIAEILKGQQCVVWITTIQSHYKKMGRNWLGGLSRDIRGICRNFMGLRWSYAFLRGEGGCSAVAGRYSGGGGLLLGTPRKRGVASGGGGLLNQIKFRVPLHPFKSAALPWAVASYCCARVLLQPHRLDTNMSQFNAHVKTHFLKITFNIILLHSSWCCLITLVWNKIISHLFPSSSALLDHTIIT